MLTAALFPILLPFACFVLLAVCWPLRHNGKLAGAISCAVAIGSCFGALRLLNMVMSGEIGAANGFERTFPWLIANGKTIAELGVRIDGISASMLVVITFVAAAVQVYSLGYLKDEPDADLGRYFTWHSLFIPAMGGLVIAPNLLQAFMCWELVGLCSYLLIGYYWTKPEAGHAAVKAFWVTKFADMGFLAGLCLLYTATGGFNWGVSLDSTTATAVAGLIFLGVMGKSAQVPLHVWLPNAMEGPTPVSALLHAATMVAAGVFVVVRAYPIFEQAPDVLLAMTWIGGITAFVAAGTAVVQDDIKKVLAYSTCSQLGYMVAALGTGSLLGGYFHLTTHAFFKALLFLGAGAAIHAVHSNNIHDMGGLIKKTPFAAFMFIVGALALAGIPGLSGFFSKDIILEEMMHGGHWGPLVLLLVSAGLTAFYMTRVVVIAFFGKPSDAAEHAHGAPLTMGAPMAGLTILAIIAGYAGGELGGLWGGEIAFHWTPIGITASCIGLAGVGYGVLLYGKGVAAPNLAGLRTFILKGPIDLFWDAGWRRALLPTAKSIAWTDRYVIDGAVNWFGWAALRASEGLRRIQTGRAQDYAVAVIAGVLFFVLFGAVGG
jgi:NADH-quinone oxidoreductase subunit L